MRIVWESLCSDSIVESRAFPGPLSWVHQVQIEFTFRPFSSWFDSFKLIHIHRVWIMVSIIVDCPCCRGPSERARPSYPFSTPQFNFPNWLVARMWSEYLNKYWLEIGPNKKCGVQVNLLCNSFFPPPPFSFPLIGPVQSFWVELFCLGEKQYSRSPRWNYLAFQLNTSNMDGRIEVVKGSVLLVSESPFNFISCQPFLSRIGAKSSVLWMDGIPFPFHALVHKHTHTRGFKDQQTFRQWWNALEWNCFVWTNLQFYSIFLYSIEIQC